MVNTIVKRLLISACLVCAIVFSSVAQDEGAHMSIANKSKAPAYNIAVVIGTDNYTDAEHWRKLSNAVFDAKSIKERLDKKYGFKVIALIDASREEILSTFKQLDEEIARNNNGASTNLLVFIAGHGDQNKDNLGYFVPKDAIASDKKSYIFYEELRPMIYNLQARHIMVMLDVCYGGTFNEKNSNKRSGYADASDKEIAEKKYHFVSRKYIASGGKEKVNDGLVNDHSPFVDRLLKLMDEHYNSGKNISFNDLCQSVGKLVNPTPVFDNFGDNYDPRGDFILQPLPKSGSPVNNSEQSKQEPVVIVIPKPVAGRTVAQLMQEPEVRIILSKINEVLEEKGIKTRIVAPTGNGDTPDALMTATGANRCLEIDMVRAIQDDTRSISLIISGTTPGSIAPFYYKTVSSGYFRTNDYSSLTSRALKSISDQMISKIKEAK